MLREILTTTQQGKLIFLSLFVKYILNDEIVNDIIKPRTVVEKISQEKINPIEKKSSNIVNHHSVIQKASKIVNKEVSPSMSNEKISNDDKEKPKEKLKEKPKEKLKHEIKSVNAPKAKDKI